jgi:hypothetical protein
MLLDLLTTEITKPYKLSVGIEPTKNCELIFIYLIFFAVMVFKNKSSTTKAFNFLVGETNSLFLV